MIDTNADARRELDVTKPLACLLADIVRSEVSPNLTCLQATSVRCRISRRPPSGAVSPARRPPSGAVSPGDLRQVPCLQATSVRCRVSGRPPSGEICNLSKIRPDPEQDFQTDLTFENLQGNYFGRKHVFQSPKFNE